MQGLADGYFVMPYTIGNYFASAKPGKVPASHAEFKRAEEDVRQVTKRLLSIKGKRSVDELPQRAGQDHVGKLRHGAQRAGPGEGAPAIPALREEFWKNVNVPGCGRRAEQSLEHAGRVADFLEFAELLCLDALHRRNPAAAISARSIQTAGRRGQRDDENFAHVAAWEYQGRGPEPPSLHKEPLVYEEVHLSHAELQMNLTLKVWRQKNAANQAGWFETYEASGRQPGHVVPRDARRGQRRPHRRAARSRSPSTPIAAKASAACARWSSTASRTAAARARPSASCTCGISRTARPSPSSRGARGRSRSSKI